MDHLCFDQRPALALLNRKLSLGATGAEQDWDIELSDPERTAEFVEFFGCEDLTKDEKYCLMSIILASFDEMLIKNGFNDNLWGQIKNYLLEDQNIFSPLVSYWAGSSGEDDYNIAPYVRDLRKGMDK